MTKRTPINAICSGTDNDVFTLNVQGQLVRSQRWFWSRRTKQLYRNRYWLTPQVRPKTVKQRHSFALMETLRTCGDSASLQKLLGRALDPGVENVYTWLRGGVLNGEADLDQRWLDGTVEHESMGTRHDNRALAARLADFLQFIQKKICSSTDNDVFTLNVQGQLVRSQRWFWSRRTKQLYRNRYWLTPQVRPKTVKQRHSFALMETLRTCGDSASLQKYVTRQLLDTSGFFKDPSFDQSRAHGTRYLMLARMDALWTARKAIQIGILVDTHPFSVDHCILCDQQLLSTSIAHLVVECEQVTGHRIQSGLVPAIQKSRLRLLGRALDPGVENVYTWLRGGVLNGEADLDQRWLDGTVEHESMGTRHDNRALAARLADFLQVAYRQYQSTLWKYHRDRLVEVG
ncbi:hypothetical protein BASA60_008415 [Batrachochytrium salamandrivorans]|nr:hypothetical protein BASA60_008415 [Batrachochytrium salamandrivorans]